MTRLKQASRGQRLFVVFDQGLLTIYGFLYILLIVRTLPKAELGDLMIADSIRYFTFALADGSWGHALIRYLAGASREEKGSILTTGMFLKLVSLVAVTVLLLIISQPVSLLMHSASLFYLLLLIPLLIAGKMIYSTARSILISEQLFRRLFLCHLSYAVIFLIGILYCRLALELDKAYKVMLVFLTANVISSLASFLFIKGLWRLGPLKKKWVGEIYRFSRAAFINIAGSWLYWKTDIFMLGAFIDPVAAAIYSIGGHFIKAFTLILEAFHMILFPAVSALSANKEELSPETKKEIMKMYKTLGTILQAIVVVLAIVVFILAEPIIILLFSEKYIDSAPVLRILLIGLVLNPFARLGSSVLCGIGKPQISALITWIIGGLNVVINLALIPIWGILGASVSSSISMAVMLLLYYYYLNKEFPSLNE